MPLEAWRYRELTRRLADLENAPRSVKRKDAWDVVGVLMPIINAVVLAAVGWWLTGAVEAGFKREQLQLAQVKEMQELISRMTAEKIDSAAALPTALTLAAYGKPAVAPLLAVLTERYDEIRGPAAEAALRAVGLAHREDVCTPVLVVMGSRAGRFGWPVHATAIRLLGDMRCVEAVRELTALERRLTTTNVEGLAADFAASPTFDRASVEQLRKFLSAALRGLKGTA
jgi:hypothetical protein